jgi:hypothetical protein
MGRDVLPVVFDGHTDVLERLGAPDGADPAHSSSAGRRATLISPGRGGRLWGRSLRRLTAYFRVIDPCCMARTYLLVQRFDGPSAYLRLTYVGQHLCNLL